MHDGSQPFQSLYKCFKEFDLPKTVSVMTVFKRMHDKGVKEIHKVEYVWSWKIQIVAFGRNSRALAAKWVVGIETIRTVVQVSTNCSIPTLYTFCVFWKIALTPKLAYIILVQSISIMKIFNVRNLVRVQITIDARKTSFASSKWLYILSFTSIKISFLGEGRPISCSKRLEYYRQERGGCGMFCILYVWVPWQATSYLSRGLIEDFVDDYYLE